MMRRLLNRLTSGPAPKPMPGSAPHWRNLVAIFERRGIDLVFDIGANTGQYAGYLRGAGYEGRIVSFEPLSAAHAELAGNAVADPSWTVAPRMALGAAPGEAKINISNEPDMSSLLPMTESFLEASPSSRTVATETVPVCTLDSVFADYSRPGDTPFVKIDTQGFEMPILEGAMKSLPGVAALQLELSLVPLYEGEAHWLNMIDYVGRRGFVTHLVIPGYFSRHLGRMVQIDVVFLREEKES